VTFPVMDPPTRSDNAGDPAGDPTGDVVDDWTDRALKGMHTL
jgi:hypothetical protein